MDVDEADKLGYDHGSQGFPNMNPILYGFGDDDAYEAYESAYEEGRWSWEEHNSC
jgi:hypothetical protein